MKNVKILSVLFAIVLMFSLCAVSVFAAEETTAAAEEVTTAADAEASEASEEEAEEHSGFEPMNFVKNLKYMGVGMLCIIIVIGVLIGVTLVLNKVTATKK